MTSPVVHLKSTHFCAPPSPSPHGTPWKDGLGPDTVTWTVVLTRRGAWQVSLKDVVGFAMKSGDGEQIWVCLKMGYTPNYSHLVGIMISKTIGFRGTQHFQTNPFFMWLICDLRTDLMWFIWCWSLVVPDVFVHTFKIVLVHVVNYDNVIICLVFSPMWRSRTIRVSFVPRPRGCVSLWSFKSLLWEMAMLNRWKIKLNVQWFPLLFQIAGGQMVDLHNCWRRICHSELYNEGEFNMT